MSLNYSELPAKVQTSIQFFLSTRSKAQVLSENKLLEIAGDGTVRYGKRDVLGIELNSVPFKTKRTEVSIDELPADAQASMSNLPAKVREDRLESGGTITVYANGSGIYHTVDNGCLFIFTPEELAKF